MPIAAPFGRSAIGRNTTPCETCSALTDGTSAMVELGVGMRTGQWSLTGGVNWMDGGALEGIGGGQITMRYNW